MGQYFFEWLGGMSCVCQETLPPKTTRQLLATMNDDTDEVSGTTIVSEHIESDIILLSRAKIRSDVAKRVRSDNDADIICCDLIKISRSAILTTNAEILHRCMQSNKQGLYSTYV